MDDDRYNKFGGMFLEITKNYARLNAEAAVQKSTGKPTKQTKTSKGKSEFFQPRTNSKPSNSTTARAGSTSTSSKAIKSMSLHHL